MCVCVYVVGLTLSATHAYVYALSYASYGSASTRIHAARDDVQCTRLRLTLAWRRTRTRTRRWRWLKRRRWWRKEGWVAAALLEEVLGRRSVCSRAMNYAVRRGLGPRTSAGRPEGGERRKETEKGRRVVRRREKERNRRGMSKERDGERETVIYPHGPELLYPPHLLSRLPPPFSEDSSSSTCASFT